MTATEQQWRTRLADELEADGSLRTPRMRAAVERVPRQQFIHEFFRQVMTEAGVAWNPVTAGTLPEDEWLELANSNRTWVTQLNQEIRPSDAGDKILTGDPTSSSTLPGLVVAMLEDLNIAEGDKILEIGTGSGYSTALLCELAGSPNVVSIEADRAIAKKAAAAIRAAGYAPVLVTGDGLKGFAHRAPYSKIVATCSVRSIPAAWLAQSGPGGMILATISGWQFGSAYVCLAVSPDGTAHGQLLPETYSFMLARPHLPPPVDLASAIIALDSAKPRRATTNPEALDDWIPRLIAQLATPNTQIVTRKTGDGPMTDYLVDASSRSVASVTPDASGEYQIRESGPVSLWTNIEKSVTFWQNAGCPPLSEFRIDINHESQRVYIADHEADHEATSWHLPVSG